MTQSSITNSRLCNYNCGTHIYWNSSKKAFVEVETGNKHFCQSRKPNTTQQTSNQVTKNRPTFTTGTGKPLSQPKHSNSIQVLKGTTEQEVQKQYETLSDLVTELGDKIHGSQSHYIQNNPGNNELMLIVVYYEVPGATEQRELVKQKFDNVISKYP